MFYASDNKEILKLNQLQQVERVLLHPPHPHQCLGVGVGLLVHDDLRHLVVAAVGGDVQRRQVVVGHVVHGHLVVQQQLDAVEVVALRRHVERRQAVLQGGGGDVDGRVEPTKQKEREKRKAKWNRRGDGEMYLGLRQYRSSSVQQHLHHLLMAAPRSTVERSQTVLSTQTEKLQVRRLHVTTDRILDEAPRGFKTTCFRRIFGDSVFVFYADTIHQLLIRP